MKENSLANITTSIGKVKGTISQNHWFLFSFVFQGTSPFHDVALSFRGSYCGQFCLFVSVFKVVNFRAFIIMIS